MKPALPRKRGAGVDERCRYVRRSIAASKTKQQQHSDPVSTMATTGYHNLLWPSTAAIHARPHSTTRRMLYAPHDSSPTLLHSHRLRGSGEGWTSDVATCVGRSQLLKQNNNNTVIPCPQWLPLATMAFFGLLRAIHPFTLNHTAKCYRHHIQQPNIAHR